MRFSIKDFLNECDQTAVSENLVTFTEKILNGKLYFLCSVKDAEVLGTTKVN